MWVRRNQSALRIELSMGVLSLTQRVLVQRAQEAVSDFSAANGPYDVLVSNLKKPKGGNNLGSL